jgi:hypothetical protein
VITLCLKEMQLRGAWNTGGRPSPYHSTGISEKILLYLWDAVPQGMEHCHCQWANPCSVTRTMAVYWSRGNLTE